VYKQILNRLELYTGRNRVVLGSMCNQGVVRDAVRVSLKRETETPTPPSWL